MIRPFLALVATLLITAGSAAAADSLKPLRTLVYNVSYSVTVIRREQTSGFGGSALGDSSSTATGHGEVENKLSSDEQGTLTVAVVAASADGGLVTDVSFVGKNTAQSTIRVAITLDGQLSYNPNTPLSAEAARVLPFLARGLLTNHQVAAGESWNVSATEPATGQATYRIVSVEGTHAVIGIDSSLSLRGPRGFDEHTQGTTTYATDVLSPISIDLTSTARHQLPPNQSDTTNSHLVATQVSDSFQHH